jgi:pyruvate dehydrogenase E2 component (dihydrolipoamide acetyltransferase)
MATDVVMPRLSDSMEEGTVLKWLVEVGDEVKRGGPLVEIETDKANMTYEADTEGVLVEIVAQEGDTLPIGQPIARIGDASEIKEGGSDSAPESKAEQGTAEDGKGEAPGDETGGSEASGDDTDATGAAGGRKSGGNGGGAQAEPARGGGGTATLERKPAPSGNGAGGERVKASPVARRMARELGVELAAIEGSGPGGRIVKADVTAAADAPQAKPAEAPAQTPAAPEPRRGGETVGAKGAVEIQELTKLQQVVGRRMAESKATAPDFAISLDVDMTEAVALRARLKEVSNPAPSFNDMVVKAAASALREHPRVNGAYRDGKWELYEKVNVGVAVAADDALVVPTVFDADSKSLGQISRDARAAIEKVREGTITPPELAGGTFTVSNLGMYGIESFVAIVNPPQAAILTVGALAKKPAVDDEGNVVARDQMTLTLVCDHRILYGADGAKFLARVKELLQQPLSLAL